MTQETPSVVNVLEVSEPETYRQAQELLNWDDWEMAIEEEIESLEKNKVWEIVDRPSNRRNIDGRWVFQVKGNAKGELDRFKARYVVKGFSLVQGVDYEEIFAPVARFDSLRLLLAISAAKRWKPRQLDIKTVFLYGTLEEKVYLQLPEGRWIEGKVACLRRAIYGLKQAPRQLYQRLVTFLQPYSFKSSTFDPCIIIKQCGNLFVAIYVDDITIFGAEDSQTEATIALLKSEFKVKDMGPLN